MAAVEGVLTETAGEPGEFMYSLTVMGKLLQTGAPQLSIACGVKVAGTLSPTQHEYCY